MRLCALAAIVAGAAMTSAAETAIWQDLALLDCSGTAHLVPSSPLRITLDVEWLDVVYKELGRFAVRRASCST